MKQYLIILLLSLYSLGILAQNDLNRSLAFQFYQNQEYDKAVELFEKLYKKSDNPTEYYKYYYTCLLKTKQYEGIEKLIKKAIKAKPGNLSYLVDLGFAYISAGDENKAESSFTGAITLLTANEKQIKQLAGAFKAINKLHYAIATFQQGQKLFNHKYLFNIELAELYTKVNEPKQAIENYLYHLEFHHDNMQYVKNSLQNVISQQAFSNELKEQLLILIQRNPREIIYADMLIWQFIQLKNFKMALMQTKAIDRRLGETGFRVLQLGKTALSEAYYDVAIDAFQYVINKGKGPLYKQAKKELLNTYKAKLANGLSYTSEELDDIRHLYNLFINEFGTNQSTASVIRDKANLLAFYYSEFDSAISILEVIMNHSQLGKVFRGELKIELGDYYLIKGDVWEASLLYSQVDKEFGDEPVGEMARFKNAKMSYYVGEFEWSQAQLNILKGSTSELIANDALELSIFITDNLGLDTTYYPMMMFARADLLCYQNNLNQSLHTLDSIIKIYPNHNLADDIYYTKAKIKIKQHKFDEAVALLEEVIKWHPDDLLGDNATYKLAQLYDYQFKDEEKAQQYYKDLIFNYKGSVFVVEARKRFRELRGDEL